MVKLLCLYPIGWRFTNQMSLSVTSLHEKFRECARFARALLLAGVLASAGGCAADIDQRGHIFDEDGLQNIQIGTTGRDELIRLLGTPNILPVSGDASWYYVGGEVERFAFYRPEILERRIVAVHFDDNDIVAGMELYSLEDGQEIALVEKETPSRGRDIGVLEEIFGNIGRFTPTGAVPGQ